MCKDRRTNILRNTPNVPWPKEFLKGKLSWRFRHIEVDIESSKNQSCILDNSKDIFK